MNLFNAKTKRRIIVCTILCVLCTLPLFVPTKNVMVVPYEIIEINPDMNIKYIPCDQHTPEKIMEEINKWGDIGRLRIPSFEIDVALFECEPKSNSQVIVNAVDSAAYIRYSEFNGRDIIADHNFQGFEGIKQAIPGETCAFINSGENIETYVCVSVFQGNNIQDDITDMDGNSVVYQDDGLLCMYTCNETWDSITITLWKQVIM